MNGTISSLLSLFSCYPLSDHLRAVFYSTPPIGHSMIGPGKWGSLISFIIALLLSFSYILVVCGQLSVAQTMAKPVPQPTTVVPINVITSAVNPNISLLLSWFCFVGGFSLYLKRIIRSPSLQNLCRREKYFFSHSYPSSDGILRNLAKPHASSDGKLHSAISVLSNSFLHKHFTPPSYEVPNYSGRFIYKVCTEIFPLDTRCCGCDKRMFDL